MGAVALGDPSSTLENMLQGKPVDIAVALVIYLTIILGRPS